MSEANEVQTEPEVQKPTSEECVQDAQADSTDEVTPTGPEASEDSSDGEVETESEQEAPPSAEEFAQMKGKLDRVKAENEERSDRMLRTIADYENSKKRAEREKAEFFKYAVEGVIKDLIPVVDNIERGIESAKASKDFDSLNEGIQLIHKQLDDLLKKRGVAVIEAKGEPFDPKLHEAMMHIESDDVPENAVIEEFQRGYLLHDRVIRPSMVSVSRGKHEEEDTSPVAEGEKEEESNE
jgi:molecular chaperone GrpE